MGAALAIVEQIARPGFAGRQKSKKTMDQKDRYGDKLRDVEHAREEQWAHQRDQELLEKLRKKGEDALCPQCRKPLVAETRAGVAMMACAHKHGAWLRAEMLDALL